MNILEVQISCDDTEENALNDAWEQWKTNVFKNSVQTEFRSPEQFDDASQLVKPQDIHEKVRVSSDIEDHIKWIEKDIKQGFEHIYIHNVNCSHKQFIKDFGQELISVLTY